ncbi:MAG: ABC transporter substrate-binding protein [Pseudomonadota bacterium]
MVSWPKVSCLRLFGLLCAFSFAFGSVTSSAQEPIHIGIMAPLSGPFAPLGAQVQAGVEQAIERSELDVRISAVDDECNEEQGRAAANQLIGAGVDFVVGGVCWRPATAALAVLAFEDIPFFASGVRYGPLTDDAMPGSVFRLNGRDDHQARFLADKLIEGALDLEVGHAFSAANTVILFTDGSYGRTLAEEVAEKLTDVGRAPALNESFDAENGLDRAAGRTRAEDPDIVMVFAGQADTALMVSALRQRGVDVPIVTGDSAMTSEFPLLADGAADGVVFPRPWSFGAGLVEPSIAATEVGIARFSGQETGPYQTTVGELSFAENGDVDVAGYLLWTWRNGAIWPADAVPEELR